MISLYLPTGTFFPKIILVNRNCVGILCTQMTQFGMLLPSLLGSILTANNSVQDASALHLGSILNAIPQFRMLLPSIRAPSSLSNTSVQDASALHLGSILTANTSVQDASALTSGLHPRCQMSQFRMLLSSLLGSILTAKYLSSGCSVLTSGLHPHCRNHCWPLTYQWRVCIIWYDRQCLHLHCWIAANEE